MNLNETWVVTYSPSLERHTIIKLMEITRMTYQAHLRGQDLDHIILSVSNTEQEASEVCDGIRKERKVLAVK